jgi:hypothetical protein
LFERYEPRAKISHTINANMELRLSSAPTETHTIDHSKLRCAGSPQVGG